LAGDVYFFSDSGQPLAAAYDLTMQRMPRDSGAEIEDWFYELQWRLGEAVGSPPDQAQAASIWLLFADGQGVGNQLAARLRALGKQPVLIYAGEVYSCLEPGRYQIDPAEPEHFQRLLNEVSAGSLLAWQGIVHLWSLDALPPEPAGGAILPVQEALHQAQARGPLAVTHLVQALISQNLSTMPGLWLVTSGSQPVGGRSEVSGFVQASLWGLGGVIVNEHPELHCKRIDLSPALDLWDVDALWAELWADSAENQVALFQGDRYVARLARYQHVDEVAAVPTTTQFEAQPQQNYELVIPTPGVLDNLTLQAAPRRGPSRGEVEIKVQAAGLNFIDVMKAMGIYPGMSLDAPIALGGECAGQIVAVGDEVDSFAIGDEVIAFNPTFNTSSFFSAYVTVPAEVVVHKPGHLSFEEATTIPICFLTAYYAMLHLGRLQAGERVLIHSATGGVGLAAIQLARLAKAEIFATAGTLEKREYLRALGIAHTMDSRSLTFGKEVKELTNGQGVDMVLNSLTGEALQQSFAALGAYGRFLEIGKRDIYQNSRLGMEPFKQNLSFFAIDLARLAAERPAMLGAMLRELMAYFEDRVLHPLPMTVFPMSEASEAFRRMAQAKHTGKVVFSFVEQQPVLIQAVEQTTTIRADATYLVSGGLGGLGLAVAQWLAAAGARHLVLLGRSGSSTLAQSAIKQLETKDLQVVVARADVGQMDSIAAVLYDIEQHMPPLRGLFHAAGILEDATVLRLDQNSFWRVAVPKIDGAWNLHHLTRQLPLDFFVLFSSVTTLLGSAGQGSYVAANAFLDALAHHRRALGLPALSINWGPWAEIGLAAGHTNRGERLAARGVGSIMPAQGIAALARLLKQEKAQVGVMPFEPMKWFEYAPVARESHVFDELLSDKAIAATQPQVTDLPGLLAAAAPGRQRRILLEDHLREQVARVLRLAASRIPTNKPLKNLGMDSLMALELRNRLEATLGLTLSATMIFNYPTIEELVRYLAARMGIALESTALNSDGTAAEGQSHGLQEGQMEDLSQDEVEAMLAEELATIDNLLKGI
jgi:NADPH:quinone reductase-like Zn-dependent oxidoreductase/acyl carrier protein